MTAGACPLEGCDYVYGGKGGYYHWHPDVVHQGWNRITRMVRQHIRRKHEHRKY